MANNIAHFAMQADDVDRARNFYRTVFGWKFEPWGLPGFYNVTTGHDGDPGIMGALYARVVPRSGADAMIGFRCTISVEDIAATEAAVRDAGCRLTAETSTIPGVGTLFEFEDTEGNIVCAMQYHG